MRRTVFQVRRYAFQNFVMKIVGDKLSAEQYEKNLPIGIFSGLLASLDIVLTETPIDSARFFIEYFCARLAASSLAQTTLASFIDTTHIHELDKRIVVFASDKSMLG